MVIKYGKGGLQYGSKVLALQKVESEKVLALLKAGVHKMFWGSFKTGALAILKGVQKVSRHEKLYPVLRG